MYMLFLRYYIILTVFEDGSALKKKVREDGFTRYQKKEERII